MPVWRRCPRRTARTPRAEKVGEILHDRNDVLLPQMTIKEAVAMFEQAESDGLAVVDTRETQAGDRPVDREPRPASVFGGAGPAAPGAVGGVAGAGTAPYCVEHPGA